MLQIQLLTTANTNHISPPAHLHLYWVSVSVELACLSKSHFTGTLGAGIISHLQRWDLSFPCPSPCGSIPWLLFTSWRPDVPLGWCQLATLTSLQNKGTEKRQVKTKEILQDQTEIGQLDMNSHVRKDGLKPPINLTQVTVPLQDNAL